MTPNREPFRSEIFLELHVPNFQDAYDFYKRFGFSVLWMEQDYMVLRHGNQALGFYSGSNAVSEHPYFRRFTDQNARGCGVEIVIFVEEIEQLYSALKNEKFIAAPLQLRPWGVKDFRVSDPCGYYVRVSERYDTVNRAEKIAETAEVLKRINFRL